MCAKNCKECKECQGELVAPICIEVDSEKYDTLEDFVDGVEERLTALEKPHGLDIKTLSSLKDLSRDAIIQILIDEIISLKSKSTSSGSTSTTVCPSIDWKVNPNCSGCNQDFCTSLQNFINTMYLKTS